MKILIDTGILLDIALNRHPHVEHSSQLIEKIQDGKAQGFLAWHTLSNFYYLTRPVSGQTGTKKFLEELLAFTDICPVSTKEAKNALYLPFKDFEDALQCAAALSVKADVIATRNHRDFRASPIPARAPSVILKKLSES